MEFTVCPHCGVRVLPSPEGNCPSCRQSVATGEIPTKSQEAVPAPVVEATVVSNGEPTVSRSNPAYVPGALLVVLSLLGIGNSVFQMFAPERPPVQEAADP